MERGAIVGGLMICGSFLLAALLNRSAMEEIPAAAPVAPVSAAPISPAIGETGSSSEPNDCTTPERQAEVPAPVASSDQPMPRVCSEPE